MNIEVDCFKKVIDDLIEAVIWTKLEIRILRHVIDSFV